MLKHWISMVCRMDRIPSFVIEIWHTCILYCLFPIFSSPESKAQVSFSNKNLTVVRHRCCKLFTFSSTTPEPLGQFQSNLAQLIFGWRGFKFIQMKGPALFQGEIITKLRKYIDKTGQKLSLNEGNLSVLNERFLLFPRGDN